MQHFGLLFIFLSYYFHPSSSHTDITIMQHHPFVIELLLHHKDITHDIDPPVSLLIFPLYLLSYSTDNS